MGRHCFFYCRNINERISETYTPPPHLHPFEITNWINPTPFFLCYLFKTIPACGNFRLPSYCQVLAINLVKITENYTHFLISMTHTFYTKDILQSQTTNIDVQDFARYITHTHLLQHLSTLDRLWYYIRLRDCICFSLTTLATIMNTLPCH